MCRLAGLADCMDRGARLPLAEGERAEVTRKTRLLYPGGSAVTLPEALRIWSWLNERRRD